jgi:hypothetical protein
MKAGQLAAVLAPFALVCDTKSPVAKHRLIQVTSKKLSARTARVATDATFSLGIETPFAIDGGQLAAVVSSLPAAQELALKLSDAGLSWRCGGASGRLATLPYEEPASLPRPIPAFTAASPALANMFDLGAISCSGTNLSHVGLFGVVLKLDRGELWCLSSDNTTISAATVTLPGDAHEAWEVTLAPSEAELLASLLGRASGSLAIREGVLRYGDTSMQVVVALIASLRYSVSVLFTPYREGVNVIELPREAISTFVKRAIAITASRKNAAVTVIAEHDKLTLQFAETRAQTEEVFTLAEFDVPERLAVTIDAGRLVKALRHCDELVIDHMTKRCLTFRAKDGSFFYIIAGRPE